MIFWCFQLQWPTAHLMSRILTNVVNNFHWFYLWMSPCGVSSKYLARLWLTCSSPTPHPSPPKTISGKVRFLLRTMKSHWAIPQKQVNDMMKSWEDCHPLEAEISLQISSVIQTLTAMSAIKKVIWGMTRDKKQLYLFRKKVVISRMRNQPIALMIIIIIISFFYYPFCAKNHIRYFLKLSLILLPQQQPSKEDVLFLLPLSPSLLLSLPPSFSSSFFLSIAETTKTHSYSITELEFEPRFFWF